jgi:uncharacterized protein
MEMKFFDANVYIGLPKRSIYRPVVSAKELLKELDRQGIEKALVWHFSQYDYTPIEGNKILSEVIKGQKNLYGSWVILPPQTGEVITDDFFKDMKKNRIVALRAFPDYHRFFLERIVFGSFLDEVSERKIPLLISMEKSFLWTSWRGVFNLLKDYPELTCILCDIGIHGVDRYTWPLLENYKNVYLETSLLALGCGHLETTVKKYGAGRIVFGSNFPERYPESSALEVLHSDISEKDREKIGSLNIERIISEEKL